MIDFAVDTISDVLYCLTMFATTNTGDDAMTTISAKKLARDLYRDDMSRADEVPVQRDGYKAYDGWLTASSDAGDRDTADALRAADRDEFAVAWNELVEATAGQAAE